MHGFAPTPTHKANKRAIPVIYHKRTKDVRAICIISYHSVGVGESRRKDPYNSSWPELRNNGREQSIRDYAHISELTISKFVSITKT